MRQCGPFVRADFLHPQDVDAIFLRAQAEGQEFTTAAAALDTCPGVAEWALAGTAESTLPGTGLSGGGGCEGAPEREMRKSHSKHSSHRFHFVTFFENLPRKCTGTEAATDRAIGELAPFRAPPWLAPATPSPMPCPAA